MAKAQTNQYPGGRNAFRDLPKHILELMKPWDNKNRFDRQVIGHIELAWRRGILEGHETSLCDTDREEPK